MYKKVTMLALTLLALLGTAQLLSACHTTAGAGEDISKTGQAIEKSADKHAP
ncbi:MAG TPA: entericidin A/B family lipoprotein [Alphaproteobacteria bacterium]|nr:entericidin A/B family lipoprotein [Alphaproteobacteria bacterium]